MATTIAPSTALTTPFMTTNSSNSTTDDPVSIISAQLLPALLNIFAIILVGYLAGQFKLLTPIAARNISKVCGALLLPSALFCGIATIDFYSETFEEMKVFLIGISIGKTVLFVLVAALCVATDRSPDRWGKAGIRGIFVTQQNDFSLGLPIIVALYGAEHPQYVSMLFLAAPISLIFLNPLAFVMMEHANTQKQGTKLNCKVMLKILLKVVRNPITWSAFLGLIVNFCTGGTLPAILYDAPSGGLLAVATTAFPFLSQFALGMVIVGKLKSMKPRFLPVPLALIFAKVILMPFIGRAIVEWLGGTDSLCSATFIYCAIPTTGGVFLYALQYGMSPHRVAIAMVLCTIVSAPVLFIMAVLASVDGVTLETFYAQLPEYNVAPAVIGCVGCIWYAFTWTWSRLRWAPGTRFQRHCIGCVVACGFVSTILSAMCQIPASDMAWSNSSSALMFYIKSASIQAAFIFTIVMTLFDAFVFRPDTKLTKRQFIMAVVITHVCVWAVALVYTGILASYVDNLFMCSHPYAEITDYVRITFNGVEFALLGIGIIVVSRKISMLRRALQVDQPAEGTGALLTNAENEKEGTTAGTDPATELGQQKDDESSQASDGLDDNSAQVDVEAGRSDQGSEQETKKPAEKEVEKIEGTMHALMARLVLTLYVILGVSCILLAICVHVGDPDNVGMQFEIQFLAETLCSMLGAVIAGIFGFSKTTVLRPAIRFLKERCKCTSCKRNACCQSCAKVSKEPGSYDPMWSALSPRWGSDRPDRFEESDNVLIFRGHAEEQTSWSLVKQDSRRSLAMTTVVTSSDSAGDAGTDLDVISGTAPTLL